MAQQTIIQAFLQDGDCKLQREFASFSVCTQTHLHFQMQMVFTSIYFLKCQFFFKKIGPKKSVLLLSHHGGRLLSIKRSMALLSKKKNLGVQSTISNHIN